MKHSNHLISLSTIHLLFTAQFINEINVTCMKQIAEQKRLRSEASKRRKKVRIHFKKFVKSISPRHFRRMFRMPLDWLLCEGIESDVGEDKFLSESKDISRKLFKNNNHPNAIFTTPTAKLLGGTNSNSHLSVVRDFLDISEILVRHSRFYVKIRLVSTYSQSNKFPINQVHCC